VGRRGFEGQPRGTRGIGWWERRYERVLEPRSQI
jgi:hypothetical protein